MRPRLLDLYCCAGGAGMGYHQAGFDVVGVDQKPQHRYPFEFIQADVLELEPAFLASFDAIHASPPCQAHSTLKVLHNAKFHPDLIPQTRELLQRSGRPWVMENAPLGCWNCDNGWRHGCMDDFCRGSNEAEDCDDARPCTNCNPHGESSW